MNAEELTPDQVKEISRRAGRPITLTAHNQEDLPMMEKTWCPRCFCDCWLGPRSAALRKRRDIPTEVLCMRCTVKAGGVVVGHLGNPLS